MFTTILIVLFAYLLGSISSAILTCKIMGLSDPRTEGSNNPGATNVLRIGGKKAAIITLLGDMLKGFIPVLLVTHFWFTPLNVTLAGVAAFLGHLYPIYFRLQGGKGVATAIGVMLGIHWTLGGALIGTWLAMTGLFRISSLSALTAFFFAPLYAWFLLPAMNPALVLGTLIISILIFWRHRRNIANLRQGTEDKLSPKT